MIRWLFWLVVVVVLVWCGATVKLGKRTFFQHVSAVWSTPEAQDMKNGIEEKAGPVVDKVERGDDAYNLDLSQRRAHAVLEYLTGKGVDAGRLQSQGYGETQPIDRKHNEEAWAKNRRVEFLILKRATDDSK